MKTVTVAEKLNMHQFFHEGKCQFVLFFMASWRKRNNFVMAMVDISELNMSKYIIAFFFFMMFISCLLWLVKAARDGGGSPNCVLLYCCNVQCDEIRLMKDLSKMFCYLGKSDLPFVL